jgi:arginyl-tRNA synthetase
MYALDRAKQEIADLLNAIEPALAAKTGDLVKPPQEGMGDLAFPCFAAAKALGKSPAAIAADVAARLQPSGLVASASGPYLNFSFDRAAFAASVLADVAAAAESYGDAPPTGEKVMVEYFSPNTHKEVHIGHLRNMALGLAVVRLYRAAGHVVVPTTYVGDVGAHVAKCLWALQKFHGGEVPAEGRGKFLGGVYAEATRLVEEKPEYKEEIAEVQRLLESRNPGWEKLWRETRDWSLEEMHHICSEFGIEFERWYLESEGEEPGKQLVKEMLASGLATVSQGATVVNLEDEGLGVFLVLKSDGSSLYSTKELALAKLKFAEYPDLSASVTVVDMRQAQYFRQFFATLRRMGFMKSMRHLAYEFLTLKDGAMSSRKGNIVTYQELRDEVKARAADEARTRHPDWDEAKIQENAWTVAEGGMKFWLLKQGIERPIVFDVSAALAFDGFTGPYVQYAYARLASILRKAGVDATPSNDVPTTDDPFEYRLARLVADLPDTVLAAAATSNPATLAQYAFDLAEGVNAFYRDVPVLAAEVGEADRARRLALAAAARTALARALWLLGIRAPEEM